jgi:hypothetical protein
MKKVNLFRFLKILALLLPVVIAVGVLQHVAFYYADDNTERIRSFYCEPDHSLDVVFLGASEVQNGFSPGYAYDKYGFTSYLYTMGSNPCTLYKSQLIEVMNRQNPQLIVAEISGFLFGEEEKIFSEARLRIYTDNIPMSVNKIGTIMRFPYEDKLSCLLPFVKYHGNWVDTDLLKSRVQNRMEQTTSPSMLKGMITNTKPYDTEPELRILNRPIEENVEQLSLSCLDELLQYCREERIDNIVFVSFPRNLESDQDNDIVSRVNKIREIIGRYGYQFIDFQNRMEGIGLQFSSDFYDFEHLNIYGQVKITDYLSEMIVRDFQITPREQTDENKECWETSAIYTKALYELAEEYRQNGNSVFVCEGADLISILDKRIRANQ